MTRISNAQIIDVDGQRIEYVSQGSGRPVIVFINGGGPTTMNAWRTVLPLLASAGTVFAYNRFGEGRSARPRTPQTGDTVVTTLRRLLTAVGLAPPYILVGHSLGGIFANLFARRHPDDIAGVVLVDSSHPDQGALMRQQSGRLINRVIMRLYAAINPTKFSEIVWLENCSADFAEAPPFPDVPLVVLTAGKRAFSSRAPQALVDAVDAQQRALAAMSPQGSRIVIPESGHYVQRDAPDAIIAAIRKVANHHPGS